MPKTKPAPVGTKQVTISKFFAPKPGAVKQANGVQIVTDDDDEITSANTDSNKRKSKQKSRQSSAKRQCLEKDTNTGNSDKPGSSIAKNITVDLTGDGAERTAKRLQAFEFEENNDSNEGKERTLWEPKDLPDVLSQDDEQNNAADSDNSDSDETPSSSQKKAKAGSGNKGKAVSSASSSKPGAQKSVPSFLDKFSSPTSSAGAPGKKSQVKYTPLEQQFISIKEKYADAVLLVECGYKYRFFGQDAEIAAEVLKIFCHPDHNFVTASIPVHRLFVHIRRLVAAGYKVGVVKQTETAALKAAGDNRSGPFTRELSALYTKSTLIGEDIDPLSGNMDCEGEQTTAITVRPNSYLMCVYDFPSESSSKQQQIGMLAVDPGTGDMVYDCFTDGEGRRELETRVTHLQPVELLLSKEAVPATRSLLSGLAALSSTADDRMRIEHVPEENLSYSHAFEIVSEFFSSEKEGDKLQQMLALPKAVLCCFAALITYLTDFNLQSVLQLTSNLHEFSLKSRHLHLPAACLRNLEVFQNGTDGSERASLFWFLNHTVTRAGARLLRAWLAQPLRDVGAITARHDAVQELCGGSCPGLLKLRESLARCPDLEKGLCSIYHSKSSALEFVLVSRSLSRLCQEVRQLQGTELPQMASALLQEVVREVPELLADVQHFSSAISEKAARENDKANLFTDDSRYTQVAEVKGEISSVIQELKDYRREIRLVLRQPSADYVTVSQTEYLVEVKNTQLNTVPKQWTQISSTKAVSRFHPPFVAEKYRRLSQLREQLVATVSDAWEQFLKEFSEGFLRYRKAVQLLASLDVLLSLAKVAQQDGYCRPQMTDDTVAIEIEDGRHPVIDALKGEGEQFVPNSTHLQAGGQRVMIVTGPNMGGKSSYIRQVALIAIMAQMGSFVPAASARLGVLDAIYTRMGAEDEIFRGRSTFMVELQEAGEIMAAATERSLVIIDELGRGTSTHDGVAIAYATLEYFVTEVQCLTLFVTHYPMLAEFQQMYPEAVGNYHMSFLLYDGAEEGSSSEERKEEEKEEEGAESSDEHLTFLYQLTEGAAGKSYGLNVARLAHIPPDILRLAAVKSHELEDDVAKRRAARQAFTAAYQASEGKVKDAVMALTDSGSL
ncbi:DNA mismatch repair protein Msh3-like [Babylonia areolata]|uniref:DNA mismatch repair protein Msh3-like n=1 Tax=Babylonia areolata TaxID=304850 RepID=UPI003FD1289C